jgi:hypothetical protein
MVGGPFGRYVIAAAVTGELLPIAGIAIFLGTNSRLAALLSLAARARSDQRRRRRSRVGWPGRRLTS